MRIVDRKTFLALPSGTIFAKFSPHFFERLAIKWETMGEDFVCQDLVPSFEGSESDDDVMAVVDRMLVGEESPAADYDCAGRDGYFDRDQLFAVWSAEDAKRLIARLQEALHESAAPPIASVEVDREP